MSQELEKRPVFAHSATSATVVNQQVDDQSHPTQVGDIKDPSSNVQKPEHIENADEKAQAPSSNGNAEGGPQKTPPGTKTIRASLTTLHDVIILSCIIIMLAWPWIFFGVVWKVGGIEMSDEPARVVTDHPQATNFFVTLVSNIISLIVSFLFSVAIIRFSQEWVAVRVRDKQDVTVFHVSLLSALRNRIWPWKIDDVKYLVTQQRWLFAALVGTCIATFTFVPSSSASLIGPIPYNRTIELIGTELDLAPTDAACLSWYQENPMSNNCDWQTYKGVSYTSCLGQNQIVDVLECGRGNILSLLSNNTEALVLSQLGAKDGLHFLGSIRGVLPMGPNGVPAFDTVAPKVGTPSLIRPRSYNYTVDHQGLSSNVTCSYQPNTPIQGRPLDDLNLMLEYNATCPDGTVDFLTASRLHAYRVPNSNNSLSFWACQSQTQAGQSPSYTVYIRGRGRFYNTAIGNITCTVSPIQPAVFAIEYRSNPGIFSSETRSSLSPDIFSTFLEAAVSLFGTLVSETQNTQANLVAESVITFGVKSFNLDPYTPTEQYLRLYEQMIQGVLEYGLSYIRLIYSTVPDPPQSCIREANGTFIYETIGWEATSDNIGFLSPMTLVNLASLIVMCIAIHMTRLGGETHVNGIDPTDPNALIRATHEAVQNLSDVVDQSQWSGRVTYEVASVIKDHAKNLLELVASPDKLADASLEVAANLKEA